MEITWHGNTCFSIKEKREVLILNPNDKVAKEKANVVLTSLGEKTGKVAEAGHTFDWPGEYEVSGIPIIGYEAWTKSRSKEEEEKAKGDPTIIFYFDIGGVRFCHLGELGHVLTSDTVKEMGDVDILMINGGKNSNLETKKAVEVLEAIDPKMVIPMGTGNLEEFLKEIGAETVEANDKLEIKSPSELPTDKRAYVLLKAV